MTYVTTTLPTISGPYYNSYAAMLIEHVWGNIYQLKNSIEIESNVVSYCAHIYKTIGFPAIEYRHYEGLRTCII